VAAATLDFFPIEGTYKTVGEISGLYARFGHADRIGMHETYNGHQYSAENQEAAIEFLDRFNGMPVRHDLPPVKELDDKSVQCTRTGQVMLDYPDAKSLMDVIREYYLDHRGQTEPTFKQLYYGDSYPGINAWRVTQYEGAFPREKQIAWEAKGSTDFSDVSIDRYLLHHSHDLELPLLYIHKPGNEPRPTLIWMGENGKATANDWLEIKKRLDEGYNLISLDPRGLGETRMRYKAASPDDPTLSQLDFDQAYVSPISGVLGDYVYNSLLTGRPYLLQVIEDVEIAQQFAKAKLNVKTTFAVEGIGRANTLASLVAEALPDVKLISLPHSSTLKWSDLVDQKTELWPIEYLLPGGAYLK
jgi:hypothetical protein